MSFYFQQCHNIRSTLVLRQEQNTVLHLLSICLLFLPKVGLVTLSHSNLQAEPRITVAQECKTRMNYWGNSTWLELVQKVCKGTKAVFPWCLWTTE